MDHDKIADLLIAATESREAEQSAIIALNSILFADDGEWMSQTAREIGLALYGRPGDPKGLAALSVPHRIGRALAVNRRMQAGI